MFYLNQEMKVGIIKLVFLGGFFVFFVINVALGTNTLNTFDLFILITLLFLFSESFLLWLGLAALVICPFLLIFSRGLVFAEKFANFSFLVFVIATAKFIFGKKNEKK